MSRKHQKENNHDIVLNVKIQVHNISSRDKALMPFYLRQTRLCRMLLKFLLAIAKPHKQNKSRLFPSHHIVQEEQGYW